MQVSGNSLMLAGRDVWQVLSGRCGVSACDLTCRLTYHACPDKSPVKSHGFKTVFPFPVVLFQKSVGLGQQRSK